MSIKLLVGLGNPGSEYEATRHNAGFWLLEQQAAQMRATLRNERDFRGRLARAGDVWLLTPTTFMNHSGQSVAAVARFYKIAPEEILVAHDELDLAPGVAKLKRGGGHAGHNGLRDIAAQLGTPDFWRLRIGIGHPRDRNSDQEVVDYVLHTPRRDEQTLIDEAIERARVVLADTFSGSMEAAMMKLHTK